MSWLGDFTNPNGPRRESKPVPGVDDKPKVMDSTGRLVADKSANRPFLAFGSCSNYVPCVNKLILIYPVIKSGERKKKLVDHVSTYRR